jgi:hypothetical protein
MPSYHIVDWEGFRVKVEPLGIRAHRALCWLPYCTGSVPRFTVRIDRISGEAELTEGNVYFYEPGEKTGNPSKDPIARLPKLEVLQSSIKGTVESLPLAMSGDHRVKLHLSRRLLREYKYGWLDIVSFNAIAKETVAVALFSALVGGMIALLAGILGALIAK